MNATGTMSVSASAMIANGEPGGDFARLAATQLAGHEAPEDSGVLLESCRTYLLLIANESMGASLKRKDGASDIVQDTFLQAHERIGEFRGRSRGELHAWLREILQCQLSNKHRYYFGTQKRDAGREVPYDAIAAEADGDGDNPALFARDPSPSRQVIHEETLARLERAIARLPDRYRRAILSRHQEALTFEEIGTRLNCSAEAARKLWNRATHKLKEELTANP